MQEMQETEVWSLDWEDPLEKEMTTHSGIHGLPWWFSSQEFTSQCRGLEFYLWVRKIPWRRKWQPLQYSWLKNSVHRRTWWAIVHGGHKNLDTTKQMSMHNFVIKSYTFNADPWLGKLGQTLVYQTQKSILSLQSRAPFFFSSIDDPT